MWKPVFRRKPSPLNYRLRNDRRHPFHEPHKIHRPYASGGGNLAGCACVFIWLTDQGRPKPLTIRDLRPISVNRPTIADRTQSHATKETGALINLEKFP